MITTLRGIRFALLFIAVATNAHGGETIYCSRSAELKAREGEWVRKDLWEKLRTASAWNNVGKPMEADIASVHIPIDGNFAASIPGWHEGVGACIKFKGDQMWAAEDPPRTNAVEWNGPFIRVGPAFASGRLFFQGIFGNKCFKSENWERWCFGPGYITTGESAYRTEVILDTSELLSQTAFAVNVVPIFEINPKQDRWYFFGTDTGWKVYREAQAKLGVKQERLEITKPWRTLSRETSY